MKNAGRPADGRPHYRIAVVGLGKIGLPAAAQYASRGWRVHGCDCNPDVVDHVNRGEAHIVEEPGLQEQLGAAVGMGLLDATMDTSAAVAMSDVVVIIVPVLVDERKRPDLRHLEDAARAIKAGLQPGTLVLLETTVPVGTTRQTVCTILEGSGLRAGKDFFVGYSPERVSSGTIFRDLTCYPKIVGGLDPASTRRAAEFYEAALDAPVLRVRSAEAAEFTKLIETTYRDVNIALANEFACYATSHGIDVQEAIEAANTQPYSHVHTPGVGVGGHCIPVYPHFLASDAPDLQLPRLARSVNDGMPDWAAGLLNHELGTLRGRRILVLGLAYRGDVREDAFTPAVPLVTALRERGAHVLLHDPLFSSHQIAMVGAEPAQLEPRPAVDAVVVQAWHRVYSGLDFASFVGCRVVLDGRNVLAPGIRDGMRFIGIGRSVQEPAAVPAES